MLGVFNNRRKLYNNNNNIMNYCRTSTENSIRRLVEREKPQKNIFFETKDFSWSSTSHEAVSMNKNTFAFLTLLSISSFIYVFLHRKK